MSKQPSREELLARIAALENETSRLKEAEAALQESETRYRAIVSAFDGLIYVCSEEYRVEFMNRNFVERTGYDPTGDLCYKALHGLDDICPWCVNDRVFQGETVRWEVRSPKDDRWYYVVNTPIRHEDGSLSKQAMILDITERKEAEKVLQEAHHIIERSPVVAFLWRNEEGWPVEYVTENVRHLFGYPAEAFISGDVAYADLVHPEDLERVAGEVMENSRDPGQTEFVHQPYRILNRDGSVRWVEDKTFIRRDDTGGITHYQGVVEDITERKKAEDALATNERFMADVFDSIQDGISVLDRDLTVLMTNRVMKEWYHEFTPLEGKKCFQCYQNREEPCDPCPALRCLRTGKTERDLVPGPEGTSVEWIELFSYPVRDREGGEPIGVAEFVRDVTAKKKLERQFVQAQKMEAVGTMAGGLAHDFNNLLMGIQGRASLVLAELEATHPHREHLKGIETYVRSASELTKQLLGFARGGKYEVKPVDMNETLQHVAEMFGRTRKEIQIEPKYDANLRATEVDRPQMEQVLLNLFINAWQAMPGGGTLYIQTRNIQLDEATVQPHDVKAGQYVKISVTDTGVGMDERVRQRVFDPFFTTKAMGRGTGLGLASAYGIVKNHGGFINVYSEPGQGTTFNIYLPASEKEVASGLPEVKEEPRTGTETVLLVDDEKVVIEVGKPMLEKLGYTVRVAKGGREALDLFEKEAEGIDLIILDMVMPDLGGGEVFDRMKAMDPDVRVLLSSGYSINGQAQDILDRGCQGFIQKPFALSDLSRKVRDVLDS